MDEKGREHAAYGKQKCTQNSVHKTHRNKSFMILSLQWKKMLKKVSQEYVVTVR
jgi:hypothetical protein